MFFASHIQSATDARAAHQYRERFSSGTPSSPIPNCGMESNTWRVGVPGAIREKYTRKGIIASGTGHCGSHWQLPLVAPAPQHLSPYTESHMPTGPIDALAPWYAQGRQATPAGPGAAAMRDF